ncbi:MAG: FdtA/QdtA family cupin domain-containing protein [Muribaculaceae bacterium]|nr:FdtA/QdtA family cupin domain-containing protein [Muribaculaceae bacterium]
MESDSHVKSRTSLCRLIGLERFGSLEGTLSVVENGPDSPLGYDVRRVFYVFDTPSGAERGGHSHHADHETLVALAGSFDVLLDDGSADGLRRVTLKSPDTALLIPPGIWRSMENFSAGSVCMVLAELPYDEADYVRDYDEFLRLTSSKR